MAKAIDIYNAIDSIAPFDTACGFDNAGFLVGDRQKEVKTVAVMLDCTLSGIEKAAESGAELIVTHHPVIFSPVKSLPSGSPVYALAQKGIALISAHTNLDVAKDGVNDCLCRALGFNTFETFYCHDEYQGRICTLDRPASPKEVASAAAKALGCTVKYTGTNTVSKLAVISGSAGDCLADAVANGADGLLCGDIKHNIFIDAVNMGVSVFDAGHYHTERVVISPLCRTLSKMLPEVTFVPVDINPICFA